MTNLEFSNEFDILYNNIMSNQAPGLDEYEKSVFLTKALDEILKAYFDPRGNKFQLGFDDSQRRLIDFSKLVTVIKYIKGDSQFPDPGLDFTKSYNNFENRSSGVNLVQMPNDILIILNEAILVVRHNDTLTLQIVPIAYDEYSRLMSKPYKRPLKWLAWRLESLLNNNDAMFEIIAGSNDNIKTYSIRYVKRPKPIILDTLEGVTISGLNDTTECELDPILHLEILQRAVELAKAAYIGDLNSQITLGQNSETNMGIVPQSRL